MIIAVAKLEKSKKNEDIIENCIYNCLVKVGLIKIQ